MEELLGFKDQLLQVQQLLVADPDDETLNELACLLSYPLNSGHSQQWLA